VPVTSRRITASVIALIGVFTMALAFPRFVGGTFMAPYHEVLLRLQAGGTVTAEEIDHAANAYQSALLWHENGAWVGNLGALRLAGADLAGYTTEEGRRLLELSLKTNRWAVTVSPLQPFAWTQMVQAQVLRYGITPEVDPLLRHAIATAPYQPDLIFQRARLALVLWPFLSEETRELARTQFLAVARADVMELVRMAHENQRCANASTSSICSAVGSEFQV
jgi:hypothetical protein